MDVGSAYQTHRSNICLVACAICVTERPGYSSFIMLSLGQVLLCKLIDVLDDGEKDLEGFKHHYIKKDHTLIPLVPQLTEEQIKFVPTPYAPNPNDAFLACQILWKGHLFSVGIRS